MCGTPAQWLTWQSSLPSMLGMPPLWFDLCGACLLGVFALNLPLCVACLLGMFSLCLTPVGAKLFACVVHTSQKHVQCSFVESSTICISFFSIA